MPALLKMRCEPHTNYCSHLWCEGHTLIVWCDIHTIFVGERSTECEPRTHESITQSVLCIVTPTALKNGVKDERFPANVWSSIGSCEGNLFFFAIYCNCSLTDAFLKEHYFPKTGNRTKLVERAANFFEMEDFECTIEQLWHDMLPENPMTPLWYTYHVPHI